MAASLALYLAFRDSANKQVSIASASEPLVEVSSLVGIDKVKAQLSGEGGDLTVSFPYKEGEIEKVSYTIEEGFLNIVVKAGEQGLTFSEKDIRYNRGGGMPKVIFVVGTPRISDLGSLFNPQALKNTTIVNIDNKNDNQGFGDIVLVSPKYSSVSEQVASLLQSLNLDIDVDIAQNLLSGILDATENFQKPNTSYLAFEMAGSLMKKGALRQSAQPKQGPSKAPFTQPAFVEEDEFQGRDNTQRQGAYADPFFAPPMQQTQSRESPDQVAPLREARNDQHKPKEKPREQTGKNPPPDWLMPKVYRGSTNI